MQRRGRNDETHPARGGAGRGGRAGAERRGSPGILPTDRGLAWLVDGQRFELADHDRSFPDRGVAAWDNSELDWQDGQASRRRGARCISSRIWFSTPRRR